MAEEIVKAGPSAEVVDAYWRSGRTPDEAAKLKQQHSVRCRALADGSALAKADDFSQTRCPVVVAVIPMGSGEETPVYVCAKHVLLVSAPKKASNTTTTKATNAPSNEDAA